MLLISFYTITPRTERRLMVVISTSRFSLSCYSRFRHIIISSQDADYIIAISLPPYEAILITPYVAYDALMLY